MKVMDSGWDFPSIWARSAQPLWARLEQINNLRRIRIAVTGGHTASQHQESGTLRRRQEDGKALCAIGSDVSGKVLPCVARQVE